MANKNVTEGKTIPYSIVCERLPVLQGIRQLIIETNLWRTANKYLYGITTIISDKCS